MGVFTCGDFPGHITERQPMHYSPRHAIARLSTATKLAIAIAATDGLLGTGVVAAMGAGASTNACNSTGFCGTQADAQANPLYLGLPGPVSAIRAGTPVIGARPDARSRLFDFWFNGLHGDLIHYAPYGHQSALCIAGHASDTVNLRPCNAAYPTQSWTATPSADPAHGDYFTIANGNGLVLTFRSNGQPVRVVPGPASTGVTRQEFKFVELPASP